MKRSTVNAAVTLALMASGATVLWQPGEESPPPSVEPATFLAGKLLKARPAPRCGIEVAPFAPTRVSVEGVTRSSRVLALPRDSRNVPGVPEVSDKSSFAWDAPSVKPGDPRGTVHLNTHTWPDGSAMGNALLRSFDKGDELVLSHGKKRVCYKVTERLEVPVEDAPVERVYDTEGPPQVVLIVCSGVRRGPGDWANRTLWFASPVSVRS